MAEVGGRKKDLASVDGRLSERGGDERLRPSLPGEFVWSWRLGRHGKGISTKAAMEGTHNGGAGGLGK